MGGGVEGAEGAMAELQGRRRDLVGLRQRCFGLKGHILLSPSQSVDVCCIQGDTCQHNVWCISGRPSAYLPIYGVRGTVPAGQT